MKTLGIIGGMGPEATGYFYHLFTVLDPSGTDQEHPDALIISRSSIPDRTAYITGQSGDSPVEALQSAARLLQSWGADYLAMPCVTAHYFYEEITKEIDVPFIHMVDETALALKRRKVKTAGLLATDGTLESGFFQTICRQHGIEIILPSSDEQRFVMSLIYNQLKTNKYPTDINGFARIGEELVRKGSETIILGCTELSLLNRDYKLGDLYADPMRILAERALRLCKERC